MEDWSAYSGLGLRKTGVSQGCLHADLLHDQNKGETICGECGLVVSENRIDMRPAWHALIRERRVSSKKVPLSKHKEILLLRKRAIRYRIYSTKDRNLLRAETELDFISSKSRIPQPIRKEASFIYRNALRKGLVRGRPLRAVVAAALYTAYRLSRFPRTLSEISQTSLVDKKDVARCYRLLVTELELKTPTINPVRYISKIAGETEISTVTQGLAVDILGHIRQKRVVAGKDPAALAATALYIACMHRGEKKTQKDIALAAGITEVTLRNHHKALKPLLNLNRGD